MNTTTYRLANPPKFAAMSAWTCAFCGHEELGRPVFLDDGNGVIAAGTGCAAKALGYGTARTIRRDYDAFAAAAARDAEYAAKRAAAYAAALVAFEARDDGSTILEACRRNYWTAGGFEGIGLTFPEFLAREAASS